MSQLMKLEWNSHNSKGDYLYHSIVAQWDSAWLIKECLELEGYSVGIESISAFEMQHYVGPECRVVEEIEL